MNQYVYDIEVFAYDWIAIFKDMDSGMYHVFHNDNDAMKEFIDENSLYYSFNGKHYDQHIVRGILQDFTPEEIKNINDFIISGNQGWEYEPLKGKYIKFNNVDIRDDMQQGLSLKAIEGQLGMDIEESEVDFNLDRPLTEKELNLTVKYCKYDVDSTEKIIELRHDYLKTKVDIGKLAGIDEVKALSMTNAKLTAMLLKATKKEYNDEREYKYPTNLKREYIPQEVFAFFDRIYNKDLSDDEVFGSKIEINIGDCPATIGYGGLHGAITNYMAESENGRTIRNVDVSSYYPHLMTIYGYTSRNMPSSDIYKEVLDKRMKAKASGDKTTANALKLVCNTTYGASLNPYNDLYDPLMARSVCISGQLFLLELANHLYKDINNLKVLQINTDGIMVEFDENDYQQVKDICKEWEERTLFELEEDVISKLAQKDVNNYIEVQTDGTIKTKGAYLVRGIAKAGSFNVNNNACIVATALKEYFANDIPVEETINSCDDIHQFQFIAKASDKYSSAYHEVDGTKTPIQKVNRVYASKDKKNGTLFKVHNKTGGDAKIGGLPDNCIIDNNNKLTIDAINKQWYIELANKQINDFIGFKKKGKKMAENKKLNIYQKLQKVRTDFKNSVITKSGINTHAEFKYFELQDIIPTATDICNQNNCMWLMNFANNTARGELVNLDNLEEKLVFEAPLVQIAEPSKFRMNEVQALGASITYLRRYLYFVLLDIATKDEFDGESGKVEHKKPASPEVRQEVKKELTEDTQAEELQIQGLKAALKKLREVDPSKEEFIQSIVMRTDAFANITKTQCEKLIEQISKMMRKE